MKVKSFTGTSLPEALKKAKDEFGENIILLESKEVPSGRTKNGRGFVEITISVDERERRVSSWAPPVLSTKKEAARPQKPASASRAQGENDFNRVISDILSRKPKTLSQEKQILQELAQLREQIGQLSQQKDMPESTPFGQNYQQVLNHLQEKGLDEHLAGMLIRRVYRLTEKGPDASQPEIVNSCKSELRHMYSGYSFAKNGAAKGQQVILLMGATGVGKTTTAMKLAAHPQIFGKKEVAIVSTDPYGITDALKAFSRMNGTAVLEKIRLDELADVKKRLKDYDVIIVDTPGQSPFAANYMSKLEEYINALKPTDIFLVVSMSTDLKDLYLSSAFFMLLKPNGLILTKFDETSQPAKVFPIIKELNLPVAAMCAGKRIFIDIKPADSEYVIERVFDGA